MFLYIQWIVTVVLYQDYSHPKLLLLCEKNYNKMSAMMSVFLSLIVSLVLWLSLGVVVTRCGCCAVVVIGCRCHQVWLLCCCCQCCCCRRSGRETTRRRRCTTTGVCPSSQPPPSPTTAPRHVGGSTALRLALFLLTRYLWKVVTASSPTC